MAKKAKVTPPTDEDLARLDIQNQLRIASDALDEAEKIANRHHLSFVFDYADTRMQYQAPPKPESITRAQAIKMLSEDTALSQQMISRLRQAMIQTTEDSDVYTWQPEDTENTGWTASS